MVDGLFLWVCWTGKCGVEMMFETGRDERFWEVISGGKTGAEAPIFGQSAGPAGAIRSALYGKQGKIGKIFPKIFVHFFRFLQHFLPKMIHF